MRLSEPQQWADICDIILMLCVTYRTDINNGKDELTPTKGNTFKKKKMGLTELSLFGPCENGLRAWSGTKGLQIYHALKQLV